MSARSGFVERTLGSLLSLGPVRARAMFGGWGLFLDDVMFGLIARERLYFKVDAQTEGRFAAAGGAPFTYERRGKRIAMSYREAPAGTIEDPGALLPWAELALEAARRGRKRIGPAEAKRGRGRKR